MSVEAKSTTAAGEVVSIKLVDATAGTTVAVATYTATETTSMQVDRVFSLFYKVKVLVDSDFKVVVEANGTNAGSLANSIMTSQRIYGEFYPLTNTARTSCD